MNLVKELRRRNVFRVGIAYVITAWLLLQVVDLVLENVNAPDWVMQVFMLALAIGFPLAVFFAWAFEMTPDGVKRESEVDRSQSITPQTGHKLDRSIIIVMAVALAWFAWDKFSGPAPDSPVQPAPTEPMVAIEDSSSDKPPAPNPNEVSVAVLPFVNMSDDKQNEYFSDGISEELLNVLVRIEGLRVPSRTSSFTFKGSGKKITEIGKELQVDHVLEGSVRKAGGRIRVTAQLIDVDTDTHLWSDTYTRELDDIFAVQDEIAQAIVGALKITLTGAEEKSLTHRSTSNVEAYNKYLLGRHLWNQRSIESFGAAVTSLREAVQMDPDFDQAWAALADAYALIPEYGAGTISEFVPLGREAAEKALAINPDSARALTAQAYIKAMFEYDIAGAMADYEKAISLEPGYATAYQWYGELLAAQRRIDEAMYQLQLASEVDPLAPIIPHVKGWILMFTDHPERALEHYQKALELNPHMQATIGNLADLHNILGQYDQARTRSREYAQLVGFDPTASLAIIDALENPALNDRAIRLQNESDATREGTTEKAFQLALLGEYELALENLEQTFEAGDPYAIHMNRISVYDPLRDNPRFQALLKKMNLWP
jgi:TolB-like protein